MDKNYLIKKWLKDELTEVEKKAFETLDDAQLNQLIIDNAQHFKASNFSKLNDFETFKTHYKSINRGVKKVNWFEPFLKIAGVLIIGLGIYFMFFNNNLTKIETLASEKTSIELPDHSKVELNVLSSVVFDKKDWQNNRVLELSGEAYFKVAKGKKFEVKTTSGVVSVMGTQFNVKQRSDYFEVKCFEGIVKVACDTLIRQLNVGDTYQILYGKFSEGKTANSVPKWIENMSDFEAIPFKEVLSELERQYNVQVTCKNIDLGRLFTGAFAHDNLQNALLAITQPMGLTYELNSSNLITIHGKEN